MLNPWHCFEKKRGMRPDWASKNQWKTASGLFRITVLGHQYFILDTPETRILTNLLKHPKTADRAAAAVRELVLSLSQQIRAAEVDPAAEGLVQQINDFMRPVVRHVMNQAMGRFALPHDGKVVDASHKVVDSTEASED
jgi:hypothetical protein